jgi:hypothetical protein
MRHDGAAFGVDGLAIAHGFGMEWNGMGYDMI